MPRLAALAATFACVLVRHTRARGASLAMSQTRMRTMRPAYLLGAALLLPSGCSDQEQARKLERDIELMEEHIAAATADLANYGSGSVLHALVSLRLSVHQQTLAMLHQKKAAAWYFPQFSYTVDGSTYVPPDDVSSRVDSLAEELAVAELEWEAARAKAEGSAGLVGALAAMEVETKSLLAAQLAYQLAALRNGFPPYVAPTGQGGTPSAGGSTERRPLPLSTEPSLKSKEAEAMQAAVGVRLLSKTYVPSDFRATRYEDSLRLEFEYSNYSEKEIRAFTGTVVFSDIFERPFHRVTLTVDDPIPARRSIRDAEKALETNQFSDEHQQLIATDLEDLTVDFEVKSILFADGTRMGTVR